MIRIPQVRVVDEDGNQLGIMPTPRALEMAQERGYDLVEVAPMASPPVARFLDFGQYKYELTKREKEAKKRQRVGFKEVRLTPKIGTGDFETKVHRAIEFLGDGDRLKVTVRFRGRELTHPELGRNLLTRFTEEIKEHGVVERAPLLEGKAMHLTVASVHKPKAHDGQTQPPKAEAKPPARTDGRADGTADAKANGTADRPAAAPSDEPPKEAPPAATTALAAAPTPAAAPAAAAAPTPAAAPAPAPAPRATPTPAEPTPAPATTGE
jgi:translation initiation factor IF-3